MKTNKITSLSLLISGLLFIIGGIAFIIGYSSFWNIFRIITICVLIFNGLSQILSIFTKKNIKIFRGILILLINIGIAIYIIINKAAFYQFVPYIVGWWALLNAIVQFLIYYAYRLDSLKHTGYVLLQAITTLIFSIILISNPISKLLLLSYIAGVYIIFYGICNILEGISYLLSENAKSHISKHIHVPLPIILASFLPIKLFMSLDNQAKNDNLEYLDKIKPNTADLEVFIYIKGNGPESLGHVDFSFNNIIYSYGCHDPKARRLHGTLGDGVLIVSKRDEFLNQAIKGDKKTIISYGIKLNEKQKVIIQKKIDNLLSRSTPWDCPYITDTNANDYASRVYKDTKCKMYKFKKGKFKTYFVFSTNCVLLVDEILKSDELNLINLTGIITPGSYIEFLNHEYLKENSCVISKTFYRFK